MGSVYRACYFCCTECTSTPVNNMSCCDMQVFYESAVRYPHLSGVPSPDLPKLQRSHQAVVGGWQAACGHSFVAWQKTHIFIASRLDKVLWACSPVVAYVNMHLFRMSFITCVGRSSQCLGICAGSCRSPRSPFPQENCLKDILPENPRENPTTCSH